MIKKLTLLVLTALVGMLAAPPGGVAEDNLLPTLQSTEFISGIYADGHGNTCTIGVSAASGGRTAGALSCNTDTGSNFNANWFTGPVIGHPFEPELVAAGIDKITGAENVAWGQGSTTTGTWYSCFKQGNVISVHQADTVLAINNFGGDNLIDCNHNFVLSPP